MRCARGGLQKCLCTGRSIGPDASRRVPRPRVARAPQVRHAPHASSAISKKISALSDRRVRQRRRAQAYSTTRCSGIAAARRHIGLHLMNDLGQLGTAVRAYIFLVTMHWWLASYPAGSKNIPTAGAASPLSEVALGVDTPVGGGWPTTSSRASEGGRRPLQLERGAQSAQIRGVGHTLTGTLLASQVPPRRSRRAAPARARWPTSLASRRPSSPPPTTSPSPAAVDFVR